MSIIATGNFVVTGATGNTGLLVIEKLKKKFPDHKIVCLIRPQSDTSRLIKLDVDLILCDLSKPETYVPYIKSDDIFIEIANLRYARLMLPQLESVGLKRAFCITTTGVFSKYHSYSDLYKQIESELLSSSIKVTILRPSMIYGNERDHNMHKLLKFINRFPVYPVFGKGEALMQPVHVDDLTEGIVQSISNDAHGEFNLAGPDALSYRDIINEVFLACGRRGLLVFVPVGPVAALAGLLQRIPGFPIKKEQVIRLQEDKKFDISNSRQELGYSPRSFATGIAQEAALLRQIGQL